VDLPLGAIPGISGEFDVASILAMAVYETATPRWPWLYVGLNGRDAGSDKSIVLRTTTGFSWEPTGGIWEFAIYGEIVEMEVFAGRLYVSLGDTRTRDRTPMTLVRTDASTWETVPTAGLDLGTSDYCFGVLEVYGDALYAGTFGMNEVLGSDNAAEVWWSEDGWIWRKSADLASPTTAEIKSMATFRGRLYVGTKNHAEPGEERTGPELWRFDGLRWELVATGAVFEREALHLDRLFVHHDALYAGTGGGPLGADYARLYRSTDGETWDQITPAGISEHSERDNYMVGALAGAGEYVFLASGLNDAGGTEVWRFAALRTDIGPALAGHDGAPYLRYRIPYPDQHISEAVIGENGPEVLGPVHDEDAARSWGLTSKQPVAYGYDHCGLALCNRYLQLVYTGHEDGIVHVTEKRSPGRGWFWGTPEVIPDAFTERAPGATAHDWAGPTGPQLTVAYTEPGTGRILIRVRQGDEWSAAHALPDRVRTSNGPEIISFRDHLYVFYRGWGEYEHEIYVARKTSSRLSDPHWEISGLPWAFTRASTGDRAVAAVIHEGELIVVYVGHNNDHLWLRRSSDGEDWERVGYIPGITSRRNPDLAVVGGELYLAFKPVGDQEVCVGTLDVQGNEHDTPGHIWRSVRPLHCWPGCFLTIVDVIIPDLEILSPTEHAFPSYHVTQAGNRATIDLDCNYGGGYGNTVFVGVEILSDGVGLPGFDAPPTTASGIGPGSVSLAVEYRGTERVSSGALRIYLAALSGEVFFTQDVPLLAAWMP